MAALTTATTAASGTQAAATAAGVTAQKAIQYALPFPADAGRAAAGAYAAVAGIPIIGPILAPAAAGVAFAGVEAFASMDIGAYKIPEDQLALVHRNELVMPAPQATAFRSMLENGGNGGNGGGQGGGGPQYHGAGDRRRRRQHVPADLETADNASCCRHTKH